MRRDAGPVHRVTVHVQPRASKNAVGETDAAGRLRVAVTAAPADGQANDAVIALLADHFRVPRSAILLERGRTARTKVFVLRGAHTNAPAHDGNAP
ncbi:MAG TPA: DUF167 domain-containing protein [Candidatus Latescibacteria bacterium]|nr:DUF167 domain-containing protein [Candidatus Latescibacterota bacterium]